MATPYSSGFVRLTSSGPILSGGDASKAILLSGYSLLSGATAAVPYILNGSTSTASQAYRLQGAGSVAFQGIIGQLPVMHPNGAYCSFDANTTEVTFYYVLQATS